MNHGEKEFRADQQNIWPIVSRQVVTTKINLIFTIINLSCVNFFQACLNLKIIPDQKID